MQHYQQQQNYATPRRDPVTGHTPDPVTGNGFSNHADGNLDGLCVKNPAPQSRAERGDE